MKFIGEAVARIAGSGSQRASALDHEIGNHAMENKTVVKRALGLLPGFGILEFLRAFRETHEIGHGLRGFFFKQANYDHSLRSIEHGVCTWCAAQDHLL